MKICKRCSKSPPEVKFHDRGKLCSKCKYQSKKLYHAEHAKRTSQSLSKKLARARGTAKRRLLPWTISPNEFKRLMEAECFYCHNYFDSPAKSTGLGIDRMNNELGYSIENSLSCCKVCNSIRGQYLTILQAQVAVNAIIQYEQAKIKHQS